MSLGTPSTGEEGVAFDHVHWQGEEPPRDEFFWISQINKCTLLINGEEGLLDRRKTPAYARGLKKVIADASVSGSFRPKMYVRYEPLMVKACGIEVTAMHAGRSSQDIHSTFQRAILRDAALDFGDALIAVRKALWTLADANRETIAPNYTNGVAAQPNSLAHTWLGHLAGFARDQAHYDSFWRDLNLCPMGTTVLNGSSWPLNRREMAKRLGFDAPIDNAYDAGQIAATDIAIGMAAMLMSPLMHVTQFIQDIMMQYASPRPWILVSATYGSSAMPQKRNPGSLIDVRRDANAVLGSLQSIIFRAHDLPPGMYDVKDVMINGEILRDAVKVLRDFARVIGLLRVDPVRALDEVNSDWTASQEFADILMRRFGIPFRLGHRIASRMVTTARTEDLTPLTFPYEKIASIYSETVAAEEADGESLTIPAAFPLDETGFRRAIDPREIVNNRKTQGGPQPDELARQMTDAVNRINTDKTELDARRRSLATAEAELETAFDALASRE